MITKRSNHMPTLTTKPMANVHQGLVRNLGSQCNCGSSTLQLIIVQYAQAYGRTRGSRT